MSAKKIFKQEKCIPNETGQKFHVAGQPTEKLIFSSKNRKLLDNYGNNFNYLEIKKLAALKCKTFERF